MSWRIGIRKEGEKEIWELSKPMYDEDEARSIFYALRDTGKVDVALFKEVRFSSAIHK